MLRKSLAVAVSSALGLIAAYPTLANDSYSWNIIPSSVKSVEFLGMPAPQSADQRAKSYSEAQVKVTYRNGKSQLFPLSYNVLHYNTTTINGVTAGAAYDAVGNVLKDPNGNPIISESPDANSLIVMKDDDLYLVTHFEYDWLDTAGNDNYGKMPMTMNLARLKQNERSGELKTTSLKNIDMRDVAGLWIPCAGSLSPWNTHLGSEEYEPDARCALNPSDPAYSCASGAIGLDAMNLFLAPVGKTARVYDYGIVPEVTVNGHGKASVEKHRALGRISREIVQMMPDERTAFQGDDGTYNVLTMFIADKKRDLSAGALYAAKWNQTSAPSVPGGEATLTWFKLGHTSDAEIQNMVDNGIKFSDIFETSKVAAPGFTTIKAGHNKGLVEYLKLKPGMETAAAFLETRRYAAYVGATTEFEKFEGVTVNAEDKKVYLAMTRMRDGMQTQPSDPVDHIQIPRLLAGAVYEIDLDNDQFDTAGNKIPSRFVGTAMRALVLGADIAKDAVGNTADPDKIANPDNLKYSAAMRTLFIGEDSSTAHINNFLWAYHVDTKQLSRILSLPAGAESTGLQAIDNLNGHAYIMSNYQHAGDFSSNIDPTLKAELTPLIDKSKAAIGYLGGLPGLK
jgi:uncharacterized protein